MKTIPLTRGLVAVVDDEDYPHLSQHRWYAWMARGFHYAMRHGSACAKGKFFYMHREILGVPQGVVVDHRDHDGFNNQKINLRAATQSQNMANRSGLQAANTSGFQGVSRSRERSQWFAQIIVKRHKYFLGYYQKPEEAAHAYDAAAKVYFGEFARLNFPTEAPTW